MPHLLRTFQKSTAQQQQQTEKAASDDWLHNRPTRGIETTK
jgi:hypothetical protein